MNKFNFLLLSLLLFLTSTCSSIKEESDVRLHDIWALYSIGGEKIVIDETVKNLPVLEIYVAEERVHGNTGCNTINGRIEINGTSISFKDIITTEMACPGDIEIKFLTALSKVNNYKIEKMRLYLYEDYSEILVLRKID